jgi:hypothetical protein
LFRHELEQRPSTIIPTKLTDCVAKHLEASRLACLNGLLERSILDPQQKPAVSQRFSIDLLESRHTPSKDFQNLIEPSAWQLAQILITFARLSPVCDNRS